jgi:hypothetical protein
MGLDFALQLMQLDVDAALYETFHQNNAAGDGAGRRPALRARWSSISRARTTSLRGDDPFSLTIAIPSVEMRLGAMQSRENQFIRTDLAALMVDDVTTPITVTLVNNQATYI